MQLDIPFRNSFYPVTVNMRLLCEVEQELGSLPTLHQRFQNHRWHLTELVALTQILLQASGLTADFMELGDEMLARGLGIYLDIAKKAVALV